MSLLNRNRSPVYDRRFNPKLLIDVHRGELSDLVGGGGGLLVRSGSAWAFNPSGVLTLFTANQPRIVMGPAGRLAVLREPLTTNKCTNHNAVPDGSLTNATKSGDAAATLTEVADSAAL